MHISDRCKTIIKNNKNNIDIGDRDNLDLGWCN